MERKSECSAKEAERVGSLEAVAAERLKQAVAAEQLGVTARQVRRLLARYAEGGWAGLRSGHRGQRPGNAIPAEIKAAASRRLRERYADFPPTLAREKLVEDDGLELSQGTVRQWMVEDGLWQAKRQKRARVHPTRPRRPRTGELVSSDGSPHAGLEGRGPESSLIALVDDATSLLLAARCWPGETTEASRRTLGENYLPRLGRPAALDADRSSVFRVNLPGREGERTQFTRALETLEIQAIPVRSPQAKGRVERACGTLQERLPCELRLRGSNPLEAANPWLPEFLEDSNRRCGKPPREPEDAHRPTDLESADLELILGPHPVRTLSKNLTFQHAHQEYGLTGSGKGDRLRGAQGTVCERSNGELAVLRNGQERADRLLAEGPEPIPWEDDQSVHRTVHLALGRQRGGGVRKPAAKPPWCQRARDAAILAAMRREGSGSAVCGLRPQRCLPTGDSAPPPPRGFFGHEPAPMEEGGGPAARRGGLGRGRPGQPSVTGTAYS